MSEDAAASGTARVSIAYEEKVANRVSQTLLIFRSMQRAARFIFLVEPAFLQAIRGYYAYSIECNDLYLVI